MVSLFDGWCCLVWCFALVWVWFWLYVFVLLFYVGLFGFRVVVCVEFLGIGLIVLL